MIPKSPAQLPVQNHYLTWRQEGSKQWQMLRPMVGEQTVGTIGAKDGELRLTASSHAAGSSSKKIPLFTLATNEDPYALPEQVLPGPAAMRDPARVSL